MKKVLVLAVFIAVAVYGLSYIGVIPEFGPGYSPDMQVQNIFDNKAEILIPTSFSSVPNDIIRTKYPLPFGDLPEMVYSNTDFSINVAFKSSPANAKFNGTAQEFADWMKNTIEKVAPNIKWLSSKVKNIDGKDVVVFEFISPTLDSDIYNQMFYFQREDRMYMVTFNCTDTNQRKWRKTATHILESFNFKQPFHF